MSEPTIRQAIFDDKIVEDVAIALRDAPERIKEAKANVDEADMKFKYDKTVDDAKQAVTDYENEIAFEVRHDIHKKDDQDLPNEKKIGKQRFPNEDKRKAETRRRCITDESYMALVNAVGDALKAKAAMEMDRARAYLNYNRVRDAYFAMQTVAKLITGLCHESAPQEIMHRHVTSFETTVKLGE